MKEVRFDNYFTSAAFTKSSNSKTVKKEKGRTSAELKDIRNTTEGDIPVRNDVKRQKRHSAPLRHKIILS